MSFVEIGGEAAIARTLVHLFGGPLEEAQVPLWVMVRPGRHGNREMALRAGIDLMGFVAPPDCEAVGVVGTGRLQLLDPDAEPSPAVSSGRRGGVRVACVVSRSGDVGWHLVTPDGSVLDHPPDGGAVLDTLCRALGLPTPPPPEPPWRLTATVWAHLVVCAFHGAGGRRRLTWAEVQGAHPHLSGTLEPGEDWEDIRLAAAAGHDLVAWVVPPHLWFPADLVAWMDDGMFARHALAVLPGPEELTAAVRPLVVPAAARRLAHFLRQGC